MKVTPPNYTQMPNDLFDHWLPMLDKYELKVLLIIMRKTFGWHRHTQKISLSDFERLTGHERKYVSRATETLQEKGLIEKKTYGPNGQQESWYNLVMHDDIKETNTSAELTPPPVLAKHPPKCQIATPLIYRSKERSKETDRTEQESPVPEPEAFQESKRLLMANGVDEQGANALSPVHSLEEIKEVLGFYEKCHRSKPIGSKGGWIADCLRKGWHKKEVEERPVIPAPVPVYVPDILDRTYDNKIIKWLRESYGNLNMKICKWEHKGICIAFFFRGNEKMFLLHSRSDDEVNSEIQKLKAFILTQIIL